MAAAHTPGPWEVSILTPTLVVSRVDAELVRNLAVVTVADGKALRSPEGERAASDAHLIAAAPDMLAALQELHLKTVIGTDEERHAALNQAWSAISKALGHDASEAA